MTLIDLHFEPKIQMVIDDPNCCSEMQMLLYCCFEMQMLLLIHISDEVGMVPYACILSLKRGWLLIINIWTNFLVIGHIARHSIVDSNCIIEPDVTLGNIILVYGYTTQMPLK